jgi:hypothetical protein
LLSLFQQVLNVLGYSLMVLEKAYFAELGLLLGFDYQPEP